ncbi:LysR family transcriptional regulator [Bosea thiooxidans]|uniref:LysR family transcriptional regulator n=1 Tax=Bosea thiooxidans TaxID=53254 RepID=A0A0Q3M5H0_9HYPH|nr:LysR family transcriptional regulator [Bosea thiooxidans]KQK31001.1 LysR family transcriptional regulator [Bosea thiooxidans]SKB94445.1 ModE molybdate transport repressor domain-containing protein [Bosea thiooxidans]
MREANLTLIQTFFIVARDGSYSAAARKLGMSYQSAANHVRRLEQMLGERLVISEQGAKTVLLTPRGRSLYKLLLPELDTVLTRLDRTLQKERPVLRIGLPQAIFFYLMPPILARFRALYPQVEIIAYERDTALPEMIKDGSLDLCITERYFGDPNVPQHLVCTYRPALVLPREWGVPPAGGIRQWAQGRPFVTYEPGQLLRNLAIDYLRPDDAEMEIAISTSGSSSVKRCVEAGLGYAVIPAWCLDGSETTIAMVDIPELPEIPIYFGEASFLARNPYVVTLRQLCVGLTAAIGTTPPPSEDGL